MNLKWKLMKMNEVVYNGSDNSSVFHITGVHDARFVIFTCQAYNIIGKSASKIIIHLNLDDKYVSKSNNQHYKDQSEWWKYFIGGVCILLFLFVIISLASLFLRRRVRSMVINPGPREEKKIRTDIHE